MSNWTTLFRAADGRDAIDRGGNPGYDRVVHAALAITPTNPGDRRVVSSTDVRLEQRFNVLARGWGRRATGADRQHITRRRIEQVDRERCDPSRTIRIERHIIGTG